MLYNPTQLPIHKLFSFTFEQHFHKQFKKEFYAAAYGSFGASQLMCDMFLTYCAGGELI